jgi:hypothetical protein
MIMAFGLRACMYRNLIRDGRTTQTAQTRGLMTDLFRLTLVFFGFALQVESKIRSGNPATVDKCASSAGTEATASQ